MKSGRKEKTKGGEVLPSLVRTTELKTSVAVAFTRDGECFIRQRIENRGKNGFATSNIFLTKCQVTPGQRDNSSSS